MVIFTQFQVFVFFVILKLANICLVFFLTSVSISIFMVYILGNMKENVIMKVKRKFLPLFEQLNK